MKYLILIHSNPTSRAVWDTLTDDQRLDFARAHRDYRATLARTGELVTSAGLRPADEATWVTRKDGDILTTDGPYAEAKEYLAGYYLVDCADRDRAIHLAAQAPDAAHTHVEVRPLFDLDSLDL